MLNPLRALVATFAALLVLLVVLTLQRAPLTTLTHTVHPNPVSVSKVSMLWGEQAHDDVYRRALKTHQTHAGRHGYDFHILQKSVAHHYWNKLYWILTVLVDELAKPEADRVEWMMWSDADTIVLNQAQRLDQFLPPRKRALQNVHLLCTKDSNGLNNGVFFIKVSQHSVRYMASAIALPIYMPEVPLPWPEQTAMWHIIQQPEFRDEVVYVPRHWINAYQQDIQSGDGAFLVHFAGVGDRKKKMREWLDRVEAEADIADLDGAASSLRSEIHDFWLRVNYYRQISSELTDASNITGTAGEAVRNFTDVIRQETHDKARMEAALSELKDVIAQSNETTWPESLTSET